MQRALGLALVPACGVALAAKPHGHFMALQMKDQCSDAEYTGPSFDEYRQMCADIDADCKAKADALAGKHNSNLDELNAECEKQKRILAGKEDTHSDEKADRKEEDIDVAGAKKAVAEKAHCRPELFDAKEDLAREEAIPNDTPADIDNECKAKKRVMEAEQCVAELEAAEAVLAKQKDQHAEESSEEDKAAAAVPPQEATVRRVCQALDDAKSKPAPTVGDCGGRRKDALLKQADKWIADLLAEYTREKGILEGKEDTHADEKADVTPERKDVKEAQAEVDRDAHCPPELEKAKAELSKQEAIPNETPADIDAECVAKKAVMEAQACVDRLRAAEKVLARQKDQHAEESSEEDKAAAAVPPQEKTVCDLKAALDAARAARKALPCDKDFSEPEPAPEKEPEKKSGATRAAGLAFAAAMLCALVQA